MKCAMMKMHMDHSGDIHIGHTTDVKYMFSIKPFGFFFGGTCLFNLHSLECHELLLSAYFVGLENVCSSTSGMNLEFPLTVPHVM